MLKVETPVYFQESPVCMISPESRNSEHGQGMQYSRRSGSMMTVLATLSSFRPAVLVHIYHTWDIKINVHYSIVG